MPPPRVLNTSLTSRPIAASVLQDIHPEDHARAMASLFRIIRAVEELGRVIIQARPRDLASSADVQVRARALIRDVPATAAHAYYREEQADRWSDRSLAHAMGQIAGRARYALSCAGGDSLMPSHASALDHPTWNDTELSLSMLHMTPAEMVETKKREAANRERSEAHSAKTRAWINSAKDRGYL